MSPSSRRKRSAVVMIYPYPLYRERVRELQRRFPERAWHSEYVGQALARMSIIGKQCRGPWSPLCLMPISFREVSVFARRGWLKSLNHLMNSSLRRQFPAAALQAGCVNGTLYALPEDVSPYVLLARRSLLKRHGLKPPTTWEALAGQLRFLRSRLGLSEAGIYGSSAQARFAFLLGLLGSNGLDPRQGVRGMLKNRKPMEQAFEWVRGLHEEGLLGTTDEGKGGKKLGALLEGRSPYFFDWPSHMVRLPAETLRDIQLFPFPVGPSGDRPHTPVHGHGWCIPHNAVVQDLAFEALRFFVDASFQRECEAGGGFAFPARKALWRDEEILARKPIYSQAAKLLSSGDVFTVNPVNKDWVRMSSALQQALTEGQSASEWLSRCSGERISPAQKATRSALVRKALATIEARLDEIQTVEQLAASFGVTSTHLRRLFRRELGESCGAVLRRRRMERAREMLSDLTLSMKEIAFQLGFNSTSYFTQAFHAFYGKSPTKMRSEDYRGLLDLRGG